MACGGCFHGMGSRSTQVTSHRMALSVSAEQTSLWDQVEFVGDPTDFAWVLPIHGTVDVGVSSDLLFTQLENGTSVRIDSPYVDCPPPGSGGPSGGFGTCSNSAYAATGTGFGGGDGVSDQEGVTVLQQEAVGPYDTVQLSATDPNALRTWLDAHGYVVPPTLDPTIDAYVAEGFGFLAVRLSPGEGIQAMQPIRVTFPGASFDLPLRMVAAGTGATTAVTLWIMGDGRYETTSMPIFTVDAGSLVWDWDVKKSNYATLRHDGLAANGGKIWLAESAAPFPVSDILSIVDATTIDPAGSGYGGDDPVAQANADVTAVTAGISSFYVSRLYAELPQAAFAADLSIGASADQSDLPRVLQATQMVGDACVQTFDCQGPSNGFPNGGGAGGAGLGEGPGIAGSGCSVSEGSPKDALAYSLMGLFGLAVAGSAARRKIHVGRRPQR